MIHMEFQAHEVLTKKKLCLGCFTQVDWLLHRIGSCMGASFSSSFVFSNHDSDVLKRYDLWMATTLYF